MFHKAIFLLLFPLAALRAGQTPGAPKPQGMPPLIDRELLFGNPEISGAQISPDGTYITFLKPWNDTRNIWIKKTDEPFPAARVLTAETKRPIPAYFWSRDSKRILFVKDNDGDENFNVFSVDPSAAGAAAKDLTGLKGVRVYIYAVPKTQPDVIYIGLNDRDKSWHDLYRLTLSTGERTLIRKNTERIASWIFDLDGNLRLANRVADNGDQDILRVEADGFQKIYSCGIFDYCYPIRFHKDGKRVYIQTNLGEARDLVGLELLDVASGRTQAVEEDPLQRVDLGNAIFSEVTDELAATTYTDDKRRIYFRSKQYESDYKWLEKKMPGMEVSVGSRTADERLSLVTFFSDTEPGSTYLFDRKGKKLTEQYKIREKIPREALAPMKAIRYKSSDGLEIPAYLTLPKGLPPKQLPLVALPHGGPWGRDTWGFNSLAQFLANRGYAVLMPNFRGSTGFGKEFLNAGNGEWGRKMQDDITWGVRHLIDQGTADPKRVAIMGGSYGGYATLAGVAFTPELYRAGVDIVGPSNLITLLEAIPPYWEAVKKIMFARMADPGTPEGRAWLQQRSPLNAAGRIKAPLLVVQGANDPRVAKAEAEQIVVALRERGFPVEYLLAPDEGHGFARPVNSMAMFMATEKFLARHLDGRYQESGTPEVVKRLAEITVDPKTVTLPDKLAAEAAASVPAVTSTLTPGTYRYGARISTGTGEMKLGLTTTVTDGGETWQVTESMQTPQGDMTDVSTLDKRTLEVLKRSVNQGPFAIDVTYSEGKASGSMSRNGQERTVAADLGGPVFADSAGAWQSIAALPLAEGYTAVIRNFDLMKQKPKLMRIEVQGSEKVTVPAGTFDAFQVEITSAEGGPEQTTVWIDKTSRKPVKLAAVVPQMGGATMTAELLK